MKQIARLTALLGTLLIASAACSSKAESGSACDGEAVDEMKELIIIDEEILTDKRTLNASNGAWSFRHTVENLFSEGADVGGIVREWMTTWVETKALNGYALDAPGEDRIATMDRFILCPWYRRTPQNQCNDDCTSCKGHDLDLASAPFRLLAIANRIDARDEVVAAPLGEARLTYALVDGPGDDPASKPLALTIAFEYNLPPSRTLGDWARGWHALGKKPAFDEDFKVALQGLTDGFLTRGANPAGDNGSALGQVRTNDGVLNWIWQLRMFRLSHDSLVLAPTRNTPAADLNNSKELTKWASENSAAVRSGKYEIPMSLCSGSCEALRFSWVLPDVEAETFRMFKRGTCNGCHTENPNVDSAFHISPFRKGRERLSTFMLDPVDGELGIRVKSFRAAICSD